MFEQGTVFDRVIQEVCDTSQVDFEESGVDQQTLLDLRMVSKRSYHISLSLFLCLKTGEPGWEATRAEESDKAGDLKSNGGFFRLYHLYVPLLPAFTWPLLCQAVFFIQLSSFALRSSTNRLLLAELAEEAFLSRCRPFPMGSYSATIHSSPIPEPNPTSHSYCAF